MLVVTDAQIAERDLWERKLKLGECSLADALILCLASGAPASPYLTARINAALEGYKDGAFTDLAEPFGMAMGKREKNAMARETWVSHVRFHVDEFCRCGRQIGLAPGQPSWFRRSLDKAEAALRASLSASGLNC